MIVLFFYWIACLGAVSTHAATLSLEDYLAQVRSGHAGIKAATLSSEGAQMYLNEARLAFRPNFDLSATETDDLKPNPLFSLFPSSPSQGPLDYQGLQTSAYSASVSEQTSIGVTGKLSYIISTLQYTALSPEFIAASPVFEFTASLWRNFLGREILSQVDAQMALAKAKQLSQQALIDGSLLEAENLYWRLALAREFEVISRSAVERGQRLFNFSEHREHLQLVDRSDPLQAAANLRARELDLKEAHDESRAARLAFNVARGRVSDDVDEQLSALTPEIFQQMSVPVRKGSRSDVLSIEAQAQAAKNQALGSREKYKPKFEVFGSYALNSQQLDTSSAISASFKANLPTKTIGVRLSMPLDLGTIQSVQQGYNEEAQSQALLWERKKIEEDRDWQDLEKKFGETKQKLALTIELEKVQFDKLKFEKERHLKGRTTLYQVLSFENDYYLAQQQRLRMLTNLINILSQMKLYGGRS